MLIELLEHGDREDDGHDEKVAEHKQQPGQLAGEKCEGLGPSRRFAAAEDLDPEELVKLQVDQGDGLLVVPVLEGAEEVPVRPAQESAKDDQEHPHNDETQHIRRDGEWPLFERVVAVAFGVAIDVRNGNQTHDNEAGQQHAGDPGIKVHQQFLQAEEVPRRLGGIGNGGRVGRLLERGAEDNSPDDQERRTQHQRDQFDIDKIRPNQHFVIGAGFEQRLALGCTLVVDGCLAKRQPQAKPDGHEHHHNGNIVRLSDDLEEVLIEHAQPESNRGCDGSKEGNSRLGEEAIPQQEYRQRSYRHGEERRRLERLVDEVLDHFTGRVGRLCEEQFHHRPMSMGSRSSNSCAGQHPEFVLRPSYFLLQRSADAAVLANTPEVRGNQDRNNDRDKDAVQHVEAQQRIRSDKSARQQSEARIVPRMDEWHAGELDQGGPGSLVADEWSCPGHVRAHRDGPHGQLVPGQQVARKRQQQCQNQQNDADAPVELARRLVAAGQEHAQHVQPDGDDHGVSAPAVHLAQQAERHMGPQALHVEIGVLDRRAVVEHQQYTSDGFDEKEEEGQPAHAPSKRQLDPAAANRHGVQVQEDVGQNGHGARTAVTRHAMPEDAAPDLRIANVVSECSEHTHVVNLSLNGLVQGNCGPCRRFTR